MRNSEDSEDMKYRPKLQYHGARIRSLTHEQQIPVEERHGEGVFLSPVGEHKSTVTTTTMVVQHFVQTMLGDGML